MQGTTSLRTKLLAQYMALVVICMFVIPGIIAWRMNTEFYEFSGERLAEDKQQIMTMIEQSLATDANGKDLHGEILRWPIIRFSVEDMKGEALFTITHTPRRKFDAHYAQMVKEIESNIVEESEVLHNESGDEIGVVTFYVVPFKISKEGKFLRRFQRNMYAGIAGMLFFAAIFAILMTNKIVRPVLDTAERAKKISEGNYEAETDIHSDIKETQMLLDSMNRLSLELAEQENLRKRMMSDIAHELRNPVTVVKGQLEAFADGVWEPTQERLNLALSEVDRLSVLIKEVEGLSVLAKEGGCVSVSMADMSELVKETATGFEPLFRGKEVGLQVDVTPNINLAVDAAKIRQVVQNLVSNALRYTDKGGNVKITLKQDKYNVIFSVADTGIGISKEDLPNIFERFYRTDRSRARESGGMGIGLAIVKAIVDAHGAKVTAESEEGVGSVFTVVFAKG